MQDAIGYIMSSYPGFSLTSKYFIQYEITPTNMKPSTLSYCETQTRLKLIIFSSLTLGSFL